MTERPPIRVVAAVLRRGDGRVLTVRKRGTGRFMLPGGKPEPGESPAETLVREVAEELGAELDPALLADFGVAEDEAANEPGRRVRGIHLRYTGRPPAVAPRAEIAELRWVDPLAPTGPLAPMLENHTLPRLRAGAPARTISAVTVFAGSAEGADPAWAEIAGRLGAVLAAERVRLVYGGASVGLMGRAADAALAGGGEVVGVMPGLLLDRELGHPGLTRFERVGTMPERKERMYALGDAFVALPGGAGTLEEFFEVWTRQHLGLHARPVALVGPGGFWAPLLGWLGELAAAGMIRRRHVDSLIHVADPAELLPALARWRAPGAKWG